MHGIAIGIEIAEGFRVGEQAARADAHDETAVEQVVQHRGLRRHGALEAARQPQRQRQYAEDTFCRIVHYETLARDADLASALLADHYRRTAQRLEGLMAPVAAAG